MSSGQVSIGSGVGVLLSILLGSGVLILPALTATAVGEWSVVAWLMLIGLFLPILVVFSMLGRRYSHNSGTAFYVEQAFGKRAGNTIGLIFISIAPIGSPVLFITGAALISGLFNIDSNYSIWIELVMLFLVFILNIAKIETTAWIQATFSASVVIVLQVLKESLPFLPL